MASTYRLGLARRLVNRVVTPLARAGLAGRHTYLLTVPGRVSGKPRTTPIVIVEHPPERWLVSPYGEVGWVRNARAAGEVALTRARVTERLRVEELSPADAAPILREYLRAAAVTRPFFDVRAASPLTDFEAEAPRHPVFRLAAL